MFVRESKGGATMILFLFVLIQKSGALNEAPANKSLAIYNPEELLLKISNITDTEARAGYGLVNLENEPNRQYFENGEYNYLNNVNFNDENFAQQPNMNYQHASNSDVTKKRRKRRKPKQNYNGFKYPGPSYYGGVPQNNYPYLADQQHVIVPSLASSALSSVSHALSSIAKYDDRQCVARLLCEAAGGALSNSLLDRVSGLQPLITLLTAYSGLSSTPMLVFGRAVLLGATSPNTASCRYAHPLCPTDTEELVHYLNNHNGGFFRFFNAPEQEQEDPAQFYNQLSQNHLHRPNQYGLYHHDLQNNKPIPYKDTGYHQYGFAFPYNDNRLTNKYENRYGDKIEKRIQNKPIMEYPESYNEQTKLVFPEDNTANKYYRFNEDIPDNYLNYVKNYDFKFPEDTKSVQNNFRKVRGFSFPGTNRDYNYFTKPSYDRFIFDNYGNKATYNRFLSDNKNNIFNKDRDISNVQTVYVVRGNGDPNRPEIIHLRPGETVQK